MNPFDPHKQAEIIADFSEAQLAEKAALHGKWARFSAGMVAFMVVFLVILNVLDIRSGGNFSMERFFAQLCPVTAMFFHWAFNSQKATFYLALRHARQRNAMEEEVDAEPEMNAELDMVPMVTENG